MRNMSGAVVASLGPGDVFGEMGMLDGARRSADVVATSPMRLITLSKWDLRRISGEISDQLQQTTEFLVRSALQQWLSELVEVQAVEVTSRDATLSVAVRYRPQGSPQIHTAVFARPV